VTVRINFVIGQISDGDFEMLESGYNIISKMILTRDDFDLFHYSEGDRIQVETENGNRLWCRILNLETIGEEERILLIFTLQNIPE
jgi:hypothetical protein